MANNRQMFKDAIAEAKSIKDMAIANAKAALEESFTPHLNTILSAKLQEMEDEDLEEDYDLTEDEFVNENEDEIDLDELLAEIENEETSLNEGEEEEETEDEDSEDEDEEPINIADMTDEDLKKYIEDVIKEMSAEGELDMDSEEDEMEDEVEVEDEEEVDLAELLAEIDDYDDDSEDGDFYIDDEADYLDSLGVSDLVDGEEIEENIFTKAKDAIFGQGGIRKFLEDNKSAVEAIKNEQDDNSKRTMADNLSRKYQNYLRTNDGITDGSVLRAKSNQLKQQLGIDVSNLGGSKSTVSIAETDELYETISKLRAELNEINVLNAKLLYTNKIFKAKNLTENQKLQVLKSFDKVSTVKESKLVYETLQEGLVAKKPLIKENLGGASRSIPSPIKKQIINENDQFARMQQLAFGENKY